MKNQKSTSLWVDKYRPNAISNVILPTRIKSIFENMVKNKKMPNLLLSGNAGMGKTTVALALCEELGYQTLLINGSLDGNIDTLRTKIERFVSEGSLYNSGMKCVILDEADALTDATQKGLRGFIEKYQNSVRFIMTCNFKNKVLNALWSRSMQIDFEFKHDERNELCKDLFKVIIGILNDNKVNYDKKVIANVIKDKFPDFRSIINVIDSYAIGGDINTGILSESSDKKTDEIVGIMKLKDWNAMRKWVDENVNNSDSIASDIWRLSGEYMTPESQLHSINDLNDFQRYINIVPDKNIAISSLLTKLMINVKFI